MTPALRTTLPRGITMIQVARWFLRGWSVRQLADQHHTERWVIERAIRDVMRRTR